MNERNTVNIPFGNYHLLFIKYLQKLFSRFLNDSYLTFDIYIYIYIYIYTYK